MEYPRHFDLLLRLCQLSIDAGMLMLQAAFREEEEEEVVRNLASCITVVSWLLSHTTIRYIVKYECY